MAKRKQCPYQTNLTPTAACSANLYRRIKRRVGRSLKRVHCQRNLVSTRKQATHKLSRTQGSSASLKRVSKSMHGQNGSYSNRQHHSGSLHKQRGRYEVLPTLCPAMENLDLVYQQTSHSPGMTHSRPSECSDRQAVQIGSDHSTRMVPSPTSPSKDMRQMSSTSNRSFCNKI